MFIKEKSKKRLFYKRLSIKFTDLFHKKVQTD